ISTPWPLPDIDFSLSLEWGGDGPPPPAPLALAHVDATSADHAGAADRYVLLSHRAHWPAAAGTGRHDSHPAAPGVLAPWPPSYWPTRALNLADPTAVLRQAPDLAPGSVPFAAVVPQDAHFTLSFARPAYDLAGFANGNPSPPPEPPVDAQPSTL